MSSIVLEYWHPDGDRASERLTSDKKKEALEDFSPSAECDDDDDSDEDNSDSDEDSLEDYKCDVEDKDCRCKRNSSRKCCKVDCSSRERKDDDVVCCRSCPSKDRKNRSKCPYCDEDNDKCMRSYSKSSSKKKSSLTSKYYKYDCLEIGMVGYIHLLFSRHMNVGCF